LRIEPEGGQEVKSSSGKKQEKKKQTEEMSWNIVTQFRIQKGILSKTFSRRKS